MVILSGAIVRAQDAQKFTQAELDASPYLKSVVARQGTMADTSKFKKKGPYKIALAAQGPTNSWAALFDQEARYHVDQLGKDKVSELHLRQRRRQRRQTGARGRGPLEPEPRRADPGADGPRGARRLG